MVENDQGEGRYVSLRGMNTDLNAMTIGGVSLMSPEDRWGVRLDGVPSDMLDSITIYRTRQPFQDLDNTGGSIDLETISAFNFDGIHAKAKLDTFYNELTKDGSNPTLGLTLTNRFEIGEDELGIAFCATFCNEYGLTLARKWLRNMGLLDMGSIPAAPPYFEISR